MAGKRDSGGGETLIINVGRLFELDLPFMTLRAEGELVLRETPPPRFSDGGDVLLAASATLENESFDFVVGVLRRVSLIRTKMRFVFESVDRFPIPLVVSRSSSNARRVDIMGASKSWGTTECFFGTRDAVAVACREALPPIPEAPKKPPEPSRREDASDRAGAEPVPSGPSQTSAKGTYRVFLQFPDNDHFIVYLPLGEDGRLDSTAPEPWLFKARWEGYDCTGIFRHGDGDLNRFDWLSPDDEPYLTDLGTVPLQVGRVVRVYEGSSTENESHACTIRDMRRI